MATPSGETTTATHVSNILGKLGATRRMEAAAIAHRLGLIEPGTSSASAAP